MRTGFKVETVGDKKRILVIDDESGYREFYKFLLEPLGYEVMTAADGREGLDMAAAREYDIIFLDVHMPKMRGPEVLAQIKKIRPSQIVVIFSSSSDPSFLFEDQAKTMGAFECMYKPVDLDDLLRIMKKAGIHVPN